MLFKKQLSGVHAAENTVQMQGLANQIPGRDNHKHTSF